MEQHLIARAHEENLDPFISTGELAEFVYREAHVEFGSYLARDELKLLCAVVGGALFIGLSDEEPVLAQAA